MEIKKMIDKVTVIIPTYNRSDSILTAIKSIIEQTYKNIELIVVDDCSTDNIKKNIKEFEYFNIKYVKNKTNKGQAASLNIGLKHATGKYIAFCDDDDEYLPDKIDRSVKFLEKNQQYDISYSSFYFKTEKGDKILKQYHHDDELFFEQLFLKGSVSWISMVFKRSLFTRFGNFKENLEISNDYDLLLRFAGNGAKFGYINNPFFIYNRHQLSMTYNKKAMYSTILILKNNYERFKKKFNSQQKNRIFSNILFREGKYFFWQKNYSKARFFFLKSIIKYPRNVRSYALFPFTFLGLDLFDFCIAFYEKITGNYYIRDCS